MFAKLLPFQGWGTAITSLWKRYTSGGLHEQSYKTKTIFQRPLNKNIDVQKCLARFKHDGKSDSVLNMTSSQYLEYMYNLWLKDNKSVSSSWDSYFKLIHADPPKTTSTSSILVSSPNSTSPANIAGVSPAAPGFPKQSVRTNSNDEMNIAGERFINGALDIGATIRAYQARGHLIADIDPLGIQNSESAKLQETANLPPAIVVREHLKSMTEADMDKEFPLATFTAIGGSNKTLPLREILTRLNKVYCGHLGLEYTYIHNLTALDWLRDKFEVPGAWEMTPESRQFVWMDIMRAVTFEGFLARKYGTEKRFGLEGCESFVPSMIECIERSAELGVETVVIGMAHRGRLNTLVNICSKPMNQMFTQFNPIALDGFGSGDVKYHLGTHSNKLLERSKKTVSLAIMANPSHLEAIDPVIVGRIRAEQVEKNDTEFGRKSLAILVHGDAAFAGQGIVYETMHLTNLPEYSTGGVMHVVINNQIGFTTDPRYSRSSAHCTDVARVVNAPIFHVHADDPDLVSYCSKIASEYRAEFHNDVVVDVVGYRRFGHNEMDEPMLTQPLMYKKIKDHPNVLQIYSNKLIKEGVITEAFVQEVLKAI